jgi:sugar lactone lactonase YvrE
MIIVECWFGPPRIARSDPKKSSIPLSWFSVPLRYSSLKPENPAGLRTEGERMRINSGLFVFAFIAASAFAQTYTIGGKLSGLKAGDSVTLLDDDRNMLVVTANGAFTFTRPLANGAAYAVIVYKQPSEEACFVLHGRGKVDSADVTSVAVACTTHVAPSAEYTIGTLAASGGTTTFNGAGVAADASGDVYATGTVVPCNGDPNSCSIPSVLKINSSGVTLVAGDSTDQINIFNCAPVAATSLALTDLGQIAVDPSGNLYVSQVGNGALFEVVQGTAQFFDNCQDFLAYGIAADGAGHTYFSLAQNASVYGVTASGVTPIAGSGTFGCSGEDILAVDAELASPVGLALDHAGANLYIADNYCNAVRKVNLATGIITTVAGVLGNHSIPLGDGGPAIGAMLFQPNGVALDAAGNIYIADTANFRIRQVNTSGVINTIAGDGTGGYSGDGGPATSAQLSWPYSVAVAPSGKVYVGDQASLVVRELTPAK